MLLWDFKTLNNSLSTFHDVKPNTWAGNGSIYTFKRSRVYMRFRYFPAISFQLPHRWNFPETLYDSDTSSSSLRTLISMALDYQNFCKRKLVERRLRSNVSAAIIRTMRIVRITWNESACEQRRSKREVVVLEDRWRNLSTRSLPIKLPTNYDAGIP